MRSKHDCAHERARALDLGSAGPADDRVDVRLADGTFGRGTFRPARARCFEAVDLRDGGLRWADRVSQRHCQRQWSDRRRPTGLDARDQTGVDAAILMLDGSPKSLSGVMPPSRFEGDRADPAAPMQPGARKLSTPGRLRKSRFSAVGLMPDGASTYRTCW
jgi:hypothetical protein